MHKIQELNMGGLRMNSRKTMFSESLEGEAQLMTQFTLLRLNKVMGTPILTVIAMVVQTQGVLLII